jgi:putative endonuclease
MKPAAESYFVYILLCANNSYYTGYTTDLNKRFKAHLAGTASKYTRSFKPIRIAQSWEFQCTKAHIMGIERGIKSLSRALKEQIIHNPERLSQHVPLSLMESQPIV